MGPSIEAFDLKAQLNRVSKVSVKTITTKLEFNIELKWKIQISRSRRK